MPRKKELEAELVVRAQAEASLDAERRSLLSEVKAQAKTIASLRKAARSDLSFDDLIAELSVRIDAEIEASASDASRSWTLVSIRKGLQALGR